MLPVIPRRKRIRQTPTLLPPDIRLERGPLVTIAVSAAPVVLEGRYRLLLQVARLFTSRERPSPLALVAGNGGAALIGVVLPGRFDDAMRIAVVRRHPGCPAGLRAIGLSLVMLGLVDSAALAPLAVIAVAFPAAGIAARAALALVAAAEVAAAAVIVALPRLAESRRARRFRLGRWLNPRTTSLCRAAQAWAFVSGCWRVRGLAFLILLGTLGLSYSFPLALLFLCAGAAAAALPIGPAAAATQAGAGTATLAAAGIGTSQALAATWPERSAAGRGGRATPPPFVLQASRRFTLSSP